MAYGQPGPGDGHAGAGDGSGGPGPQGGPPPWQGPGQPGGPSWGPPPPPPGWGGPPPWGWGWPPPAPKPGVIPLRPLQAGDLFGGVFATMRRYPGALFGVIAVVYGVYAVIAGAALLGAWYSRRDAIDRIFDISADAPAPLPELTSVAVTFGLVWLAIMVLAVVANAAVAVACTTVAREAVLGRPASFGHVLRSVKGFPTVLGIHLLSGFAALAPIALGILFLFLTMIALLDRGDVGLWLSLLPFLILGVGALAVWLWVLLVPATPAAVFEGQGAVGAIRRSIRLVRGSWWRTFGLLLLAGLMAMGVSLAVQIFTGAFQGAPAPLAPDADTGEFGSAEIRAVFIDTLAASAIGSLVGLLVQIAAMALTHLTAALVYVDLRIRKEGLADALIANLEPGAGDGTGPGPAGPPAAGQGG
ncbi:hypothetical protein [Streptomyces sp. NPDC058373]|uniref:DUF7847 domain-containing protein n=1 Tax=Streptomyces sp. NPDC058373 TaxID=3346465 RepID=UPI003664AB6C